MAQLAGFVVWVFLQLVPLLIARLLLVFSFQLEEVAKVLVSLGFKVLASVVDFAQPLCPSNLHYKKPEFKRILTKLMGK